MSQRSETLKQFGKYMRGTQAGLSSWINPTYYPLELTLVKGAIVGKDFFVDVSRRIGHDLQELCRVYPHLPERLFLQDQAGVIQEAKALYPHIQVMSHDFFTPQPIQGQLPFTSPSIQPMSNHSNYYHRSTSMLPRSRPPRVARPILPQYPRTPQRCHNTRLQQTSYQREQDLEPRRQGGSNGLEYTDDVRSCGLPAYRERLAYSSLARGVQDPDNLDSAGGE